MDRVVDQLGLVLENEFLTVYIPATNKAFVFRVKNRANRGYEIFNYGSLPFTSGESLPTYEGGSVSVPADGVLPGRAYNRDGKYFPLSDAYDETDMWYVPEDYRERVFHVIQKITPEFLRVDIQIPKDVVQARFQRDKATLGIDKDFGFARGSYETVHVPKLRYGYRWGNDTNMKVYTTVQFAYGEYVAETPKNSELIFDVLTRQRASHWVSLMVNVYDESIKRAFLDTYNIEGFPVYGKDERSKALREYDTLLREVKI